MRGKDCSNFRKDKCRGMNCPSYNICPIQWGTANGTNEGDYDRSEY